MKLGFHTYPAISERHERAEKRKQDDKLPAAFPPASYAPASSVPPVPSQSVSKEPKKTASAPFVSTYRNTWMEDLDNLVMTVEQRAEFECVRGGCFGWRPNMSWSPHDPEWGVPLHERDRWEYKWGGWCRKLPAARSPALPPHETVYDAVESARESHNPKKSSTTSATKEPDDYAKQMIIEFNQKNDIEREESCRGSEERYKRSQIAIAKALLGVARPPVLPPVLPPVAPSAPLAPPVMQDKAD